MMSSVSASLSAGVTEWVHMPQDKGQHLQYVVCADTGLWGRVLIDTKLNSSTFGSLQKIQKNWCHTSSIQTPKEYNIKLADFQYLGLKTRTKVNNDATEKTVLCDLPAGDWSGFQFWITLDYSQSGLFNAGNKKDYFLTKISLFFLKSTECGPCGWIHYRDGNRNIFTASDVTENIL